MVLLHDQGRRNAQLIFQVQHVQTHTRTRIGFGPSEGRKRPPLRYWFRTVRQIALVVVIIAVLAISAQTHKPFRTRAKSVLSGKPDSIFEELSSRAGIEPAMATIYNTLERLEQKGFVKSRQGEATAERGGRAKMYFELTGLGQKALDASLNAIDRMRAGVGGLKPVGARA